MTEEQRAILQTLSATGRANAHQAKSMHAAGDDFMISRCDAIDAALAEIDRQAMRIERLEAICGKVNEWRRHRIATYGPDEPATLPIVASILAEAAAMEGRD